MKKVKIHCNRCNKLIAHLTPEDAAYGVGVTTICMQCTQSKPYRTWVDIRDQQGERQSKTVQEQFLLLTKRGKRLRSIMKDSKRHSKFKYTF